MRDRWRPGIDVAASSGRADSGDIEIDLVELLADAASIATDVGTGIALFIDEMQDLSPRDVSALCAACHELSQTGAPLIVVGAGLPHLPAVLSAAKSYSERLFRYLRIDRLDRLSADQALCAPAARERVDFEPKALDVLYDASGGYPYFVQAYGKATWDHAPQSPITADDVRVAAPDAESELAVGFFGSRFERATPAERDYMRAMAAPRRHRLRRRCRRADGRDRPLARTETGQPLARPRRTDQEGPHLLRRARHRRVHRPALRSLSADTTDARGVIRRRK